MGPPESLDQALIEIARLQRALSETEKAGEDIRQKNVALLDQDGGAQVQFLWIEFPDTVVKTTSYQS